MENEVDNNEVMNSGLNKNDMIITFRLPKYVKDEIDRRSHELHMSTSKWLRLAIESFVTGSDPDCLIHKPTLLELLKDEEVKAKLIEVVLLNK